MRALAAALALAGTLLAGYLAAYQLHGVSIVWEPFFGNGSERVLHSFVSRALPIPDALLGAIAYGLEFMGLSLSGIEGGKGRYWFEWGTKWLMIAMALGSLGLILLQGFVIRAWCTLCLASALISWVILIVMRRESHAKT